MFSNKMYISTQAIKQIKENGKYLKITVEAGGCAGFKYDLEYANEIKDFVLCKAFEIQSFKNLNQNNESEIIITDNVSYDLIQNIHIDYLLTLGYENFHIFNPDLKNSCGCGNSFS